MIQAGKKSAFQLNIIETVGTIMLYSYKELSDGIILFELHKAMKGGLVICNITLRPAKGLVQVHGSGGRNPGYNWPIIWLIQENRTDRDFSAWIFSTKAGHWQKSKHTHQWPFPLTPSGPRWKEVMASMSALPQPRCQFLHLRCRWMGEDRLTT